MLVFLSDHNDQHKVIYLFVCPFIFCFPEKHKNLHKTCSSVEPLLVAGQLKGCCEKKKNAIHLLMRPPAGPAVQINAALFCEISIWTQTSARSGYSFNLLKFAFECKCQSCDKQ